MKKYRLLSLVVVALLCFIMSCSSDKEKMMDILSLPEHSIKAVQYNKDEIVSKNPWEFHRVGEHFFVFNGMPTSAALVFRMADFHFMGEFMSKGMGPGECLTPRYAGCSFDEDTVYIFDSSKSKMTKFLFPEQTGDSLHYTLLDECVSPQDNSHLAACRLANGLTVAFNASGTRHLFSLYDERMDSLCTFGSLPLPVADDELKNFLPFQGILVTEGNTIYFGCKGLPYLCAYEVESKEKIKLKFQYNYLPTSYTYTDRITVDRVRNIESFRDIKIQGDYIWATFLGNSLESVLKDPDNNGYSNILLVFDKQGKPLAKFKLPHKGSHICFSEEGKELYHFTSDINVDVIQVSDLLEIIGEVK